MINRVGKITDFFLNRVRVLWSGPKTPTQSLWGYPRKRATLSDVSVEKPKESTIRHRVKHSQISLFYNRTTSPKFSKLSTAFNVNKHIFRTVSGCGPFELVLVDSVQDNHYFRYLLFKPFLVFNFQKHVNVLHKKKRHDVENFSCSTCVITCFYHVFFWALTWTTGFIVQPEILPK